MHSKIFIPRDETPKSVVIAVPSSIIISMLLLSDLWRCQHQLLAAKLKDENMTGKCLELWIIHKNRRDTWSSLILGEYTGIFSSDLCFSKIYFRCCSDLKAEWGEEQQVLSGGPTPREERCNGAMNTGVCERDRTSLPALSSWPRVCVNINAMLKRKSQLASQHLIFSCLCCTLLFLQVVSGKVRHLLTRL